MAYCAVADIESKIQYTDFSDTSNPTETQVTTFCGEISQDMDDKMQPCGIAVPVTDDDKLKTLKRIACFGVLAEVYRCIDEMIDKAKMYQDLYDKELKNVLNNKDIISATDEVTNNPTWTGEAREYESSETSEYFNINEDDW